jgi:cell division protein FtsZ
MPRIEEFPAIAQRQIAMPQLPAESAHHDDERRPMSLLKRLASGFRRDDHESEAHHVPSTQPPPREPQFRSEPRGERPLVSGPRPPQDGAPRGQSGGLDNQGRQPTGRPQMRASEEDQLEIPAFLRRQATDRG